MKRKWNREVRPPTLGGVPISANERESGGDGVAAAGGADEDKAAGILLFFYILQ